MYNAGRVHDSAVRTLTKSVRAQRDPRMYLGAAVWPGLRPGTRGRRLRSEGVSRTGGDRGAGLLAGTPEKSTAQTSRGLLPII